ncbi:uncharacterized protein TNCV_2561171 [Trichonephila clavipes]|uniref:Uncharacterized protein n=1 Tax=Trichonephila clavipes TaxID=2585209 RepID=A0A8X6R9E4_TRICX|nr:uncharacterized protein TNCV_2561171 [Trichonephila clavipes]
MQNNDLERVHLVSALWGKVTNPTLDRFVAVGSLVVRASNARPEGLGSMLDVTKYPPSAHGFTCRNCGGGDRGRVAIYRPFGEVSLSLNRTVTCMVLKANDRRTSCPYHDEFRGPRSDHARQVALATTTDRFVLLFRNRIPFKINSCSQNTPFAPLEIYVNYNG